MNSFNKFCSLVNTQHIWKLIVIIDCIHNTFEAIFPFNSFSDFTLQFVI